jgi:hypothetical protein
VVAALSPKLPPGKPIPMQTLHTVQARSCFVYQQLQSSVEVGSSYQATVRAAHMLHVNLP